MFGALTMLAACHDRQAAAPVARSRVGEANAVAKADADVRAAEQAAPTPRPATPVTR